MLLIVHITLLFHFVIYCKPDSIILWNYSIISFHHNLRYHLLSIKWVPNEIVFKIIQIVTYIILFFGLSWFTLEKKPGRIGSDFFWIFVNRWLFPSFQFLICLSGHQVLGKIQVFQNKIMMTSPLLQDGSKQSQISPKNYENGQIWCK